MRILHINYTDKAGGGAGIAAYRLHQELINQGIDSNLYLRKKTLQEENIFQPNLIVTLRNKANIYLELGINKLIRKYDSLPFGLIHDLNVYEIMKFNPDIINLNWIHGGFISLNSLKKIKKPIVWTLHDMYIIGEFMHYYESCKNEIKESSLKKCKDRIIQGLDNITFVTPSNWLKKEFYKNKKFCNKRVEVIHNGIPLNDTFSPISKSYAKNKIGIKPIFTIMFGVFGVDNLFRKGFDLAKQALKILYDQKKYDLQVIIIGRNENSLNKDFYFDTYYFKKTLDEKSLAEYYSAADLYLITSRADNLPNTGLESLSCGTPIVGFDVGGIPDIIQHKHNGYLAKSYDIYDFVVGIDYVLNNLNILSKNARSTAENKFDVKKMAFNYINLYKELLEQSNLKRMEK